MFGNARETFSKTQTSCISLQLLLCLLKYLQSQRYNYFYCSFNKEILRLKNFNETYYSLDIVRRDLHDQFDKIISSMEPGIYVLNAQPGLGKTHTYLDYMEHSTTPFLIAAPTIALARQIYDDARKRDIPVMITPSMEQLKKSLPSELQKTIEQMYQIEAGQEVFTLLQNLQYDVYLQIEAYFSALNEIKHFGGHIITTHARLLNMDQSFLERYTIVVDEDFIHSIMVTDSIIISDLRLLRRTAPADSAVYQKVCQILNGDGYFILRILSDSDRQEAIPFLSANREKYHSNIGGVLFGTTFYYDENANPVTVRFLSQRKLSKNLKYIICSATANEQIYHKVFASHHCVKFYKGNFLQNTKFSISRFCLKKHEGSVLR